jgi:hypothetical protein
VGGRSGGESLFDFSRAAGDPLRFSGGENATAPIRPLKRAGERQHVPKPDFNSGQWCIAAGRWNQWPSQNDDDELSLMELKLHPSPLGVAPWAAP